MLPAEERQALLDDLDHEELQYDFGFWGRPEQHAPPGEWNVLLVLAGRGWGKALDSTTPIPTPTGFTPIGALRVGDTIFDHAGQKTAVAGVFPQGQRECVRVIFDDGAELVADLDHLWTVIKYGKAVTGWNSVMDYRERPADWWRNPHCSTVMTRELAVGDAIPLFGGLDVESDVDLPVDPQATRKLWRRVAAIEPVGARDATCIAVSAESELFLAGEGYVTTHNTRMGAEWVRKKAMENPGCRMGLVARTAADVHGVMLNGESGIMNIGPPSERPEHKISQRKLIWPNGSIAETFSAEEPDSLRGPSFHFAWCDEFAAWKHVKDASGLNAWDNARIACREGDVPQIIATTTPKRTPALRELLEEHARGEGAIKLVRGTTYENAGNLSQVYLNVITGVYEGTSLAQQELMGIMLEEMDGALFTEEMIGNSRVPAVSIPPLRVVAVDPSVAESPTDECGIIVVGSTRERQRHKREAWVLEDATVHGSPEVWVKRVVEMANKWSCPVVAEKNQGHALIDLVIKNVDPSVQVLPVHSKVGKKLRAEPVALVYERGQVHHVGYHPELEAQMTTWIAGETRKSPDRLDALVHGVTALLIAPPKPLQGHGGIRAHSPAARRLPVASGPGGSRLAGAGGRRAS